MRATGKKSYFPPPPGRLEMTHSHIEIQSYNPDIMVTPERSWIIDNMGTRGSCWLALTGNNAFQVRQLPISLRSSQSVSSNGELVPRDLGTTKAGGSEISFLM